MISTTNDYQKLQVLGPPKRLYCHYRLSVVVAIARDQFLWSGNGRKPRICRWNCHPTCHGSRDISSLFPILIAVMPFPVVGYSQSFGDSLFRLAMVRNNWLAVGFSPLLGLVVVPGTTTNSVEIPVVKLFPVSGSRDVINFQGRSQKFVLGYKSFGGIQLFNSRSEVILPDKKFTWTDISGGIYTHISPVATSLAISACRRCYSHLLTLCANSPL